MKTKLQALSDALREGRLLFVGCQYRYPSSPDGWGWDISAFHRKLGVLSTLNHYGHVFVNGKPVNAPKSGMDRRSVKP